MPQGQESGARTEFGSGLALTHFKNSTESYIARPDPNSAPSKRVLSSQG
jgi:hypothetical protein